MGKRSNFERIEKDKYYTFDPRAYVPLEKIRPTTFYEPCAGEGDMVKALSEMGFDCTGASDIEPSDLFPVPTKDALELTKEDLNDAELIITNPPWTRSVLHPMIEHFSSLVPSVLLFDADWAYTKQAREYLDEYCIMIMPIGRLKWRKDTKQQGKDNAAWYFFHPNKNKNINIEFIT